MAPECMNPFTERAFLHFSKLTTQMAIAIESKGIFELNDKFALDVIHVNYVDRWTMIQHPSKSPIVVDTDGVKDLPHLNHSLKYYQDRILGCVAPRAKSIRLTIFDDNWYAFEILERVGFKGSLLLTIVNKVGSNTRNIWLDGVEPFRGDRGYTIRSLRGNKSYIRRLANLGYVNVGFVGSTDYLAEAVDYEQGEMVHATAVDISNDDDLDDLFTGTPLSEDSMVSAVMIEVAETDSDDEVQVVEVRVEVDPNDNPKKDPDFVADSDGEDEDE